MTGSEFKETVIPCYRRMYATAVAILRNEADAADAVQDTVSHLWRRHALLAVPESAAAFCCTAVRNHCIDRLRSAPARYMEAAGESLAIAAPDASDAPARYASARRCVARAIEALPESQRTVMAMSLLSQLSTDEICRATGLSAANVRKILSRGRLKLKTLLNDEFTL